MFDKEKSLEGFIVQLIETFGLRASTRHIGFFVLTLGQLKLRANVDQPLISISKFTSISQHNYQVLKKAMTLQAF
jgi:hypothetical protein